MNIAGFVRRLLISQKNDQRTNMRHGQKNIRGRCFKPLPALVSGLGDELVFQRGRQRGRCARRTRHVTARPLRLLQQVARQMNVTLRPDVPLPKIFLESNTPLRQFQQAIAPQWKFRPHVFANAYAVERNEIYLSDDPRYYKKRNRTLDDSLAHEFVHYIQLRYRNDDLADESCEMEAIAQQLAFIDSHASPVAARVSS